MPLLRGLKPTRFLSLSLGLLGLVLGALVPADADAQVQPSVTLSSTAYVDYYYLFSSPLQEEEGLNGFTFRRLYLTSNFTISKAFKARARLEAGDGFIGSKGAVPYVKDLYLTWQHESGVSVTAGLTSPPVFVVSEDVWGYRSLEKTILDLAGVVSSRDMGVRVEGPLLPGGALQYAVMLGNNNGTKPEDDKYKRVYGQLRAFPNEHLVLTLGGDYADYNDERDRGVVVNGFAGYVSDAVHGGVEGFWNRTTLQEESDIDKMGVSVFAGVQVAPAWELVGRFDRVHTAFAAADVYDSYGIFGLAYRPAPQVRFMPNVVYAKQDDVDDAALSGRVTLELKL